jgi:hypothetical protein
MDCNGLRRSHGQTLTKLYGPEIGPAQLFVTPNQISEIVSTRRERHGAPRSARLYVRSGAITSRHLRSSRLDSGLGSHGLQRSETNFQAADQKYR